MIELVPRAVCYECHKPETLCICDRVPRVENQTQVIVVQHPRERLHPIGTARFAKLGLAQVRVEIAWDAGVREDTAPSFIPEGAALLYPSANARDLRELTPEERPRHLVVIDGTWHTARTLYRDKAWLQRLPAVRFSPTEPSRYRIRREPEENYVSTIEAIVTALRVLEPNTQGLDGLLAAFDGMIDDQLEFIERGSSTPRTRELRPKAWRKTPRALVEDFNRLVVTYAESSRAHPRGPRSIVHFAAVALASGATFERLVLPPSGLPNATHLAHMQLQASDFSAAVERSAFLDALSAFLATLGPDPILSAWNQSTLDVLGAEMNAPVSRVSLKSAYRNAHGGGSGSLDDVMAQEALAIGPHRFRGRAGERLERAVTLARHLNAVAHAHDAPNEVRMPDASIADSP